MMNLLLDIGNSSIIWAIEKDDVISHPYAFNYQKTDPLVGCDRFIHLKEKPDAVLLSCVADNQIANLIETWVYTQWQITPWRPMVTSCFNRLKNSYQDMTQMGIDRWLAMIAAWEQYNKALCIVDCGTATTIDLIDNLGMHLGGYILPGIELMQQTLISNTDRIKAIITSEVAINIANNTQAAINNGASLATIAAIDKSIAMLIERIDIEPQCLITGGMAEQIRPHLQTRFKHDQNLVLNGLSIMYRSEK